MIGRFVALTAAATMTMLLQGCAPRPEQILISDFFAASRLRDLTALARIGTVVFEPRDRGIVTTFRIRSVSAQASASGTQQKDVAVEASVRTPDGRSEEQALVFRLQRRSAAQGAEPTLYGGWMVTAITQAPPPNGSPPS